MIDQVMSFVATSLDSSLRQQYPSAEPHAVLAGLTGSPTSQSENRIVLSLANMVRETGAPTQTPFRPDGSSFAMTFPPINLNLFVLVAASYGDNYLEALKFLSAALGFFQSAPIMTPASFAGFPAGLDRLTLEFVSLTLQDLNSLWTLRGSAFLPSFMLKVRTVPISRGDIRAVVPAISNIETNVEDEGGK